jgi:hypothetical protein
VWQVKIPGLTPGQAFNGIRLVGTNDFTVGGGGGGIVRTAQAYADVFHTFNEFLSTIGSGAGATVPGTGTGQNVDVVLNPVGFTSTDLVNGTFYVGFCVNTTVADPGLGEGLFRTSALNWTLYTGTDQPSPPPGTASGSLSNPVGNQTGQSPGGQFASVTVNVIPVNNGDTPITAQFNLPTFPGLPAGTLLFASNGAAISPSLPVNAGNLWTTSCGLINISSLVPPGTYNIGCFIQSGGPPGYNFNLFANLVVMQQGRGWFFEI